MAANRRAPAPLAVGERVRAGRTGARRRRPRSLSMRSRARLPPARAVGLGSPSKPTCFHHAQRDIRRRAAVRLASEGRLALVVGAKPGLEVNTSPKGATIVRLGAIFGARRV